MHKHLPYISYKGTPGSVAIPQALKHEDREAVSSPGASFNPLFLTSGGPIAGRGHPMRAVGTLVLPGDIWVHLLLLCKLMGPASTGRVPSSCLSMQGSGPQLGVAQRS